MRDRPAGDTEKPDDAKGLYGYHADVARAGAALLGLATLSSNLVHRDEASHA